MIPFDAIVEANDESSIVCNQASVSWPIPPLKSCNNGDKMVLENVSFTVNPGELLTIVGQVGSGKVIISNRISVVSNRILKVRRTF